MRRFTKEYYFHLFCDMISCKLQPWPSGVSTTLMHSESKTVSGPLFVIFFFFGCWCVGWVGGGGSGNADLK